MADRLVKVFYDDGSSEIVPYSTVSGAKVGGMVPPTPGPAPSMMPEQILGERIRSAQADEEAAALAPIAERLGQRSALEQLGLMLYGAGQGATANFLDEAIKALGGTEVGPRLQEQYKQFQEERPYATFAAEAAGGFAIPAGRSASVLKQALLGAAAGLGSGEDMQDRLSRAVMGGTAGGGLSLAGKVAGGIAEAGIEKKARDVALEGLSPAERNLALSSAFQGLDLEPAIQKALQEGPDLPKTVETMGERMGIPLGPQGQQMTTQKAAREFATQRQETRPERLQGIIQRAMPEAGQVSGEAAHIEASRAATEAAKAGAKRVANLSEKQYNNLEWQLEWTPNKIEGTVQALQDANEAIKKAGESIEGKLAAIGGGKIQAPVEDLAGLAAQVEELAPLRRSFNNLNKLRESEIGQSAFRNIFQGRPGGLPDPADMTLRDYKELSSYLKRTVRQGRGQWPTELQAYDSKEIAKLSQRVNNELKNIVDGLGEVDAKYPQMLTAGYGGMKPSSRKALEAISSYDPTKKTSKTPGEIVLNLSPETVRDVLSGAEAMGQPDLKKQLASSIRTVIEDKMQTAEGQKLLSGLLGRGTKQREILSEIIGKQETNRYVRGLKREMKMASQESEILGGSKTRLNLSASEMAKEAEAGQKGLFSKAYSAVVEPRRALANMADLALQTKQDPALARQVLDILLQQGEPSLSGMIRLQPVVQRLQEVANQRVPVAELGAMVPPRLLPPLFSRAETQD